MKPSPHPPPPSSACAEGPREFIIPPPPPPSPPASPPPPPSPSSATINVQDSTQLMEVALTVSGPGLVPFNAAVQRNVLLAANNTWLGNDGMTGVTLNGFDERGGSVALRLKVGVTQPQAPAAASFVQTTVTAGTLDLAFRDEGGWLLRGGARRLRQVCRTTRCKLGPAPDACSALPAC